MKGHKRQKLAPNYFLWKQNEMKERTNYGKAGRRVIDVDQKYKKSSQG